MGDAAVGPPATGPPAAGLLATGPPAAGLPIPGLPITGPPATGQQATGLPIPGPPITGPPITGPPITGPPITGPPIPGPPPTKPAAVYCAVTARVEQGLTRLRIDGQRAKAASIAQALKQAAAAPGGTPAQLEHILQNLTVPCGLLCSKTILEELLAGRIQPAELMQMPFGEFDSKPNPRAVIQGALYRALVASAPAPAPTHQADLAVRLERAAYNHVINLCMSRGDDIMRSWTNPNFVSHYSARVSTILRNIDPAAAMARSHGGRVARQLHAGEITPEEVGGMSEHDMCPEAFAAENQVVAVRKTQAVVVRTTTMWVCPNGHRCSVDRQVQTRSADEPASIFCTCMICHIEFRAA